MEMEWREGDVAVASGWAMRLVGGEERRYMVARDMLVVLLLVEMYEESVVHRRCIVCGRVYDVIRKIQ